jgi:hypothetical protein
MAFSADSLLRVPGKEKTIIAKGRRFAEVRQAAQNTVQEEENGTRLAYVYGCILCPVVPADGA